MSLFIKRVVVAIGGNALIRNDGQHEIYQQLRSAQETAGYIADFIALGYEVVLTHGNGPQVGFILRRSELAFEAGELHFVPLKNCVADTQGAIGYQLQESLHNSFRRRGMKKSAATLVTMVEVDADDPSFQTPTKPIGVFYPEDKIDLIKAGHPDWNLVFQDGKGYRRVVPSPEPKRVIESAVIRTLMEAGHCVIASGGGGIPVVVEADGSLSGVNAVIDKDLSSALLANELAADMLVILTAVDNVFLNFNTPQQQVISFMTAAEAEQYLQAGHFATGSMGPKVQAAVNFLRRGGRRAVITSAENLVDAIVKKSGTHIVL
ncbi:MAG: carbamate kinase [Desulfuromonadales bacterium]|nr:carbamate kinase [Desulfuromonadales bacterium]MBN2793660.1 carbamate kinase [Desulfuromonadales bacterium]